MKIHIKRLVNTQKRNLVLDQTSFNLIQFPIIPISALLRMYINNPSCTFKIHNFSYQNLSNRFIIFILKVCVLLNDSLICEINNLFKFCLFNWFFNKTKSLSSLTLFFIAFSSLFTFILSKKAPSNTNNRVYRYFICGILFLYFCR